MSINLCAVVGGNTGGIGCDGKRRVSKKPIVGGKQFSASEYANPDTLKAAILAAINLPSGDPNKLFPFPEVLEIANNTEADTTGSLALGPMKRLRKGRPAYTYSVEIGHYHYQKLLAFDNKLVPCFTLDDAFQFWGYRAGAAANTLNTNPFKGEMVRVTISGNGFEDGTNATSGVATISFYYQNIDDFELRSAYAFLTGSSAGDFEGLKDIVLYQPQAHTTNVYKIGLVIPLPIAGDVGNMNVYDDYAVALAAMTWTAGTGANFGTPLTITSVAVDATLKCLTFTFDSTAYAALASPTNIKVTPPSMATYIAGGVTGVEIGTIIVVKP
jgi:hypothetical protein